MLFRSIQRIIKVLISGITKTTEQSLSKYVKDTLIKIQFNSILPDDLKEAVDIVTAAVNAGVMSKKTAVEYIDMTDDANVEVDAIINEVKDKVIEN